MRRRHLKPAWLAAAILLVAALKCSAQMSNLSERYVKLVLAVGVHDADYVDAYYGPPEWRTAAAEQRRSIAELDADAAAWLRELADEVLPPGADELERPAPLLETQSSRARSEMLRGERLTFDEESRALYDAVAPAHTEQEFQAALRELDGRLPGSGTLLERYQAFREQFEIPKDRLSAVFAAAIEGCRARTLEHIALPPTESFTVEYVTGKTWSGYNWYQGNYRSLIQINTDLPIYIDRAIDLACHEGYPGHHVYNVLLEQHLGRERGWQEFSVYPLFSPQSLIAEAMANYSIRSFGRGDAASSGRCSRPLGSTRSTGYYDVLGMSRALVRRNGRSPLRDSRIDAAGRSEVARDLRVDGAGPRRAARAVHRSVRRVRHQLQPRQGSRRELRRAAQRIGSRAALERVREADLVA
jgi:hypothetical protein